MTTGYMRAALPSLDQGMEAFGNVSNAAKLTQTIKTSNTIEVMEVYHKTEKRFAIINKCDFDSDIYVDGAAIKAEIEAVEKAEQAKAEAALQNIVQDEVNTDSEETSTTESTVEPVTTKRKYNRKK